MSDPCFHDNVTTTLHGDVICRDCRRRGRMEGHRRFWFAPEVQLDHEDARLAEQDAFLDYEPWSGYPGVS